MNLNNLTNKKICFLGLGIENYALVEFLISKKINCQITICDAKNNVKTQNLAFPQKIKWHLGKNYDKNLNQYDIIFRIAGYPLFTPEIKKATGAGVEISSPTKLFFDLCPSKNIIGITGTKGKGTTASLIYAILKKSGKRVFLGGNIGIPIFGFIQKIKKNDWVILELSSFQLEDLKISPKIAVLTNFYKEHLKPVDPVNPNYHKSLASYWKAKTSIFKYQNKDAKLIINKTLKPKIKKCKLKSRVIYFTKSNLTTKLVGPHNKENIAASVAVAKIVGVKNEIIKKAVSKFKSLAHRLEFIKKVKEIKYYNDSFATIPESTITALKSFNNPIILLAGGADKGSKFKQLARIIKQKVKFVILLNGQATPKIKKELLKATFPKDKIKLTYNLKNAVKLAKKKSASGDIVLLSPACASFGMFKNYKERGELFKKEIKKL